MIRVYLLPVTTDNNTQSVSGLELIEDAILNTTEDPNIRQLIMDTTDLDHAILSTFATSYRDATQEEIAQLLAATPPSVDPPYYDEVISLLATSPSAITPPQMWRLLRIYGERLGYF